MKKGAKILAIFFTSFAIGQTNSFATSMIYWTDLSTKKIQRANLDGSGVTNLITTGLNTLHGIALDPAGGKMYWTDSGLDSILRANLNGTQIESLVTTGLSSPIGIALDVSAGKMYWTDSLTHKIQRANLNGDGVEDLVTTGLQWPRTIALDIVRGKMYWTDSGTVKIQRANLDGSGVEDLVTHGLGGTTSIALDVFAGKLYWTDLNRQQIRRANLNGSSSDTLVTTGGYPRGIALDVSAGKMYWTDSLYDKIQRANVDGSGVEDLVTTGLDYPIGIALDVPIPKHAIIFVDIVAPGGGDGSSWEKAFRHLQVALANASSGDEIRVAQGNYKPDQGAGVTDGDRAATFQLIDGVTIKGGYAGFGEPDPNARDIDIYVTILCGDIGFVGFTSDNSYHVVTGSRTNEAAVLDGFTITAGNANESYPSPDGRGGGMQNDQGSPSVRNCVFSANLAERGGGMCNSAHSSPKVANCTFLDNSASYQGGGMYNCENGSNPTITNCIFSGNSAISYNGGGMYNSFNSGPTVTNCTFSGNSAKSGGGMCNGWNSNVTVTNCNFVDNTANYNGGGIHNEMSSETIVTDCRFSGNSAARGGGMLMYYNRVTNCIFSSNTANYGGGIYHYYVPLHPPPSPQPQRRSTIKNCSITENSEYDMWGEAYINEILGWQITNCMFVDNSGEYGGGAMIIYHCNPTLINCTFRNNKTEQPKYGGGGGGIFCINEASPTLINCEFTGNVSQKYGGGMYNNNWSSPILWNCTFIGNSGGNFGGGICNLGNSNPTLTNCIIWGNEAQDGPQIYLASESYASVNYSDVHGGEQDVYVGPGCALIWGVGNIDADPLFVDPGYWGDRDDPNIVVEPNDPNALWVCGDYHLLSGSPCVDAGDPNYAAEPNETDLDGRTRVMGGRIDMGAYESLPSIPAEARIIPRTINLASKGNWITCYMWLPEQYNVADIDTKSVILEQHIKSEQLSVDEQKQVAIATFSREEVQSIVDVGEVELTIYSQLTDGTVFEALDVIRVIDEGGGKPDKYMQASVPNPPDGAIDISATADLSWTAGSYITSHDVYFGTSNPPPFVCNQTATTFDPGTMDYDTTYYWRIDEVSQWGTTTGQVWSFTIRVLPGQASNPNPTDGKTWVNPDADLSWTAGSYATSHDVYFGTSSTPPFITNQTSTTFDPGTMVDSTMYYWRIDEVSKWGVTMGQLWSFTTPPPLQDFRASGPNPADGAMNVNIIADLSWTAGYDATSHDVYFGTSNPPPFVRNQTATTYDSGLMNYSTTYYWRIDEVSQWGTTTGEIWKFTTFMSPPPPP